MVTFIERAINLGAVNHFKHIYKFFVFILIGISSLNLSAQLNGTYTIGGTSPDYASFTEAVDSLNSLGVSGPVIFNVRSGTYPENFTIGLNTVGPIAGSTVINTITFQSETKNANDVVLEGAIRLIGTFINFKHLSYIPISLNSIDVETKFGYHFAVDSCVFKGVGGYKNVFIMIFSPHLTYTSSAYLRVTNSSFYNGGAGIMGPLSYNKISASEIIVVNNLFSNQKNMVMQLGSANKMKVLIKSNEIIIEPNKSSFNLGVIDVSGVERVTITENIIRVKNNRGGISFRSIDSNSLITNNFITIEGTEEVYGIYNIDNNGKTSIFNNSIQVTNTNPLSTAIDNKGTSATYYNNIFSNTGGGYAILSDSVITSNYNDLYSTGVSLAQIDTVDYSSLSSLSSATGMETHSLSIDPMFVSDTNLHVNQGALSGVALPLLEVQQDIDGEIRDILTPDIGADEFIFKLWKIKDTTACNQLALIAPAVDLDFSWSTGDTTRSIIVDTSGIFWLEVSNLTDTIRDTINVQLFNMLFDSITANIQVESCKGSNDASIEVQVNDSIGAVYDYVWDAATGNQLGNIASGLSAGMYEVTINDSNACFYVKSITVDTSTNICTGITEFIETTLEVYPNPAENSITISSTQHLDGMLTLSNMQGQVVLKQSVKGNRVTLALNNLSSGLYLLSLIDNAVSYKKTIVVK